MRAARFGIINVSRSLQNAMNRVVQFGAGHCNSRTKSLSGVT